MPSASTTITPPRVAFLDPRTGLISREWYRFLLNLFKLTGSGSSTSIIEDLETAPFAREVVHVYQIDPMPFAQALVSVDHLDMMPFQHSTVILTDDVTGLLPPRNGGAILYSYYNLGGF